MKKIIVATLSLLMIAGIASAQDKTPAKSKPAAPMHKAATTAQTKATTAKVATTKAATDTKTAATKDSHAAIARKHTHKVAKAAKQSSK